MFYLDAANDRIAVGTSSPTHTLTVNGNANFGDNKKTVFGRKITNPQIYTVTQNIVRNSLKIFF